MVVRRGTRWRAPYPADDHQEGRWPGAVDVPAVWSAVAALDAAEDLRDEVGGRQRRLVERLRREISARVPDVDVVGDPGVDLGRGTWRRGLQRAFRRR